MKESCSFTDESGAHWCFKTITNVHREGFAKAFICCGAGCNCKLFYSSPTNYCAEGVHCCLFDHERAFQKGGDSARRLLLWKKTVPDARERSFE